MRAFEEDARRGFLIVALLAFMISVAAAVYALTPRPGFTFAFSGSTAYEGLYEFRGDLAEIHRRLAYDLQRFWDGNDKLIRRRVIRAYRISAGVLVVEIACLGAAVSGTIFT